MLRFFKWIFILLVLAGFGLGGFLYFFGPPVNVPLAVLFGGEELDREKADQQITAPDDFSISIYATGIKSARILLALDNGDLLVSAPSSGTIYRLTRDADGDGAADVVSVLMDGLNRPHGLAFHDGWLYVAEEDAIGRAPLDQATLSLGPYEKVVEGLPVGGNHWRKNIGIGPDEKLYLTIGSPCNVCKPDDPRMAAMLRFNLDGSGEEIYATGLRNSVGFDWAPDGSLYATDNGRDLLGDDFPPEELNRIVEGGFYGWPHVNGFGVPDPDCGPDGRNDACRTNDVDIVTRTRVPAHGFRAHNAPLGMAFVDGYNLPPSYRDVAVVALHGSWNRSEKDGYKVVALTFKDDGIEESDFVTGFLKDGKVIGRPVDVEQDKDGAIFISDDYTGTIYKVVYGGEQRALAAPTERVLEREVFDAEKIAEGETLYMDLGCQACHVGEDATSTIGKHVLKDLADRYTSEDIAALLDAPPGPMPRYNLTDSQKQSLAAYLLTTY